MKRNRGEREKGRKGESVVLAFDSHVSQFVSSLAPLPPCAPAKIGCVGESR